MHTYRVHTMSWQPQFFTCHFCLVDMFCNGSSISKFTLSDWRTVIWSSVQCWRWAMINVHEVIGIVLIFIAHFITSSTCLQNLCLWLFALTKVSYFQNNNPLDLISHPYWSPTHSFLCFNFLISMALMQSYNKSSISKTKHAIRQN